MAATTRLSLYNGALRLLGERPLASLVEAREPRRQLDASWDDNVVDRALEAGLWLFATRSMQYDYSPSIGPEWGYSRGFDKPTDFVRTAAVCEDEYFRVPLTQYADEAGYWYADLDTIYVRYVSNGSTYGNDMARWPQSFVKFLEALMASEIAEPLTHDGAKVDKMLKLVERQLIDAKSKNAMADPAKFMPTSSWVNARAGNSWGRFNRTGQR
jgi:hypothetical protein